MISLRKWLFFYYVFFILAPVSAIEKEILVFPGDKWQRATPESQGIDPAKLYEALAYLHANSNGVGTDEMVIVRNGYLLWEGPDANNVHEIYSCTKTFTSTVLGLLVTDGLLSVDDYANKIGMKNFSWSNYGCRDGILFNNPAGTPGNNQGGIHSCARDLARYGFLYLNEGSWKGEQILKSTFIKRSTSTQVPTKINTKYFDLTGRYGFFWWTNGKTTDGKRPWPSAPPKTYAAHGAGRNFIFVIPEWSMVIVRLSPAPGGHVNVGSVKKGVWEEFFSRLRICIKE